MTIAPSDPRFGPASCGLNVPARTDQPKLTPSRQPLLLTPEQVAGQLGISLSMVKKMHRTARLPKPVRLGRALRWPVRDLERWVEAGCPRRDKFEAMKKP